MIVFCQCKNCNREIRVRTWTSDRGELKKEKGKTIEIICPHCNDNRTYELNDVKARINNYFGLIFTAILIVVFNGGFLLFQSFGNSGIYAPYGILGATTIPFAIYFVFVAQEQKKAKIFNSYRV